MLWFRTKCAHFVRVDRGCWKKFKNKFRKYINVMISDKKCPFCSSRQRALKEIQKKILTLWFRTKSAHFVRVERGRWNKFRKKFRKNIDVMILDKKCPFCSGRERALKEIQEKIQKKYWRYDFGQKVPILFG